MTAQEIPVAFACEDSPLIGMIHRPGAPSARGVLAIVAGGPQYRAGCCRQLVQMSRSLASEGIPVMRFDYRGLGDAAGDYKGFLDIGPDLHAAIAMFQKHVPSLKEIILWGGCDAASAAMIHGPRHPMVTGMMLGNPFVHSEETAAKAIVKHYYLRRIRERGFWKKLLRLEFNPWTAMKSLGSALGSLAKGSRRPTSQSTRGQSPPFPQQMLEGMQQFRGNVLLMMSGLSLVSKEFDELVSSSPEWQRALRQVNLARVDFPDADQAFSTNRARLQQIEAAKQWLRSQMGQ